MKSRLVQALRNPRFWAVLLIVVGLGVAFIYGTRTYRSYRQFQYARAQGLLDGSASVEAIQPWMPIRYVAVAYAVPEEYIFAALEIPFERRNRNASLRELNREFDPSPPQEGEEPPIVDAVGDAILVYRENPVATGLSDIRPWMSLQYIANSTGVPASYLFGYVGIPEEGNAYKPLDQLAEEERFRGGPRRLVDEVRDALEGYEAEQ